jgi:hypothetical protein
MPKTLSEFHYSCLCIDGACFGSNEALHEELVFKLGLPKWYERNWNALFDCLSSIGNKHDNLCKHWNWLNGKRLVFSIQNFSMDEVNPDTLIGFLQVVGMVNNRLAKNGSHNRIWVEYNAQSGGQSH